MILWLASVALFFSLDAYGIIKTVCAMVLSSVLICVFFIDLEHKIIPDRFSVILAVLGVVLTVSDALLTDGRWTDHLIGLAVGGGKAVAAPEGQCAHRGFGTGDGEGGC